MIGHSVLFSPAAAVICSGAESSGATTPLSLPPAEGVPTKAGGTATHRLRGTKPIIVPGTTACDVVPGAFPESATHRMICPVLCRVPLLPKQQNIGRLNNCRSKERERARQLKKRRRRRGKLQSRCEEKERETFKVYFSPLFSKGKLVAPHSCRLTHSLRVLLTPPPFSADGGKKGRANFKA